ncbi:PAAR domain-containing protein [Chryseobacterium kwangjuense]|uniref:Type VI secretion protein n=1 Tax=Chryseobacterium kwangjuense TaxID=267125 RepID=A0A135W2M9_9FLAO|nr:PAAR domain-containing protein [Chryseobacterium kwangjuense]KXH79147.1 type VI secretion protein [Chryseobacterium kwangjuense]
MGLAARSTDMHVCPASDGPKPHVGGPILPGGNTTVIIGGLPAAVVGDSCTCAGPPDTLIKGSSSVLIAGKAAVRMGDSTAHGGQVILGCFTVLIGD